MALRKNKVKFMLLMVAMVAIMLFSSPIFHVQAIAVDPQVVTTSDSSEDEGLGEELEGGGTEDPNPNETTFEGFQITESVILDKYLYSALLNLYKAYDSNYSGSIIYSDMFKNFKSITLDKKNISSLSGFEKLELDNLESFSANLNDISEFDKSFFQNIDENKFKSLSLAGNKLKEIDLANFDYLRSLDLSSNSLSSIDLSVIEGKIQNTSVAINLANNKFSSIKDIILPTKRIGHIDLNIINNNITDLTDTYFTNAFTMHVGIQGFISDEGINKVDTAKNLIVYPFNLGDNLAVEIYKTDGEIDELVATISDANIVTNYQVESLENAKKVILPVGEYEYVYTIGGEPAYTRNDHTRLYLDSSEIAVIPQKVSFLYVHKGKEYTELGKVTGKVTVKLSSPEANAKIFYQVNGSEWIEGNEVVCDNGGSYAVNVKAVIDGVEGEVQSVWVRTSLNLYVSDWLMLVLVVLLALVLFLVVLPIVSKKYFKKD